MSEQRILELEQQLVAANESVAKLTSANATLTSDLSDAQVRNKKLRRSAKNDERAFREQLAVAQRHRG